MNNVFDVIPMKVGEEFPDKEHIWHFKIDVALDDATAIEEIKFNFERWTKFQHGIILKNKIIRGWF